MFSGKRIRKNNFILDGDICAETVLGSIMMFKKQDIMKIGLYDENFFLYFLNDELFKNKG